MRWIREGKGYYEKPDDDYKIYGITDYSGKIYQHRNKILIYDASPALRDRILVLLNESEQDYEEE